MFNDTVELTTFTASVLNETTGIYADGTATSVDITCNWQPAGKKDIELLPELMRDRNTFLVMTETEIHINDRIKDENGVYFRVHVIENFSGFVGEVGKWEGICVEEKE